MSEHIKKYTLMWVPKSGLFFDGSRFTDGRGETLQWDRVIRIYSSHKRAQTARDHVVKRFPDAKGELVMLNVEIQEIPDEATA